MRQRRLCVRFDACVTEAGWADKSKLNGKLIDGRYHGLGIACFIEGGASGPRENARMVIERDGAFAVYVGSSGIGQGIETILAQIAADALEMPMERITVFHGSTTYLKQGYGSYGSRATVMGGCAVLDGCKKMLDLFRASAARRLGVAPETLTVAEGVARAADGRSVPLAEVAGDSSKSTAGSRTRRRPTRMAPRSPMWRSIRAPAMWRSSTTSSSTTSAASSIR